ncbi:hypothetical protein BSM4216_0697 [Bacillus smithii]|nr:hypothetical protein BSM4216_0697 [Bacillus smithii]
MALAAEHLLTALSANSTFFLPLILFWENWKSTNASSKEYFFRCYKTYI